MNTKSQTFNGLKFTRDDKTGYYLNSTIRKRMHIYVWEFYNGKVPSGYEIHHIDHDKSNNDISNLQLIKAEEHRKYHANNVSDEVRQWRKENLSINARPKANEWHGSEEGRKWHKKQYTMMGDKLHEHIIKVCEQCGKEYEGEYKSRFCSNACKSASRRESGVDNENRICVICGNSFITNKYSEVCTCSLSCRSVLSYESRKSKENG